jgi:hypothetical protein
VQIGIHPAAHVVEAQDLRRREHEALGFEQDINGAADDAAHVVWPPQREHEVVLLLPAPLAQGAAEALPGGLDAEARGRIEEPEEADRGVDEETCGFTPSPAHLALEEAVHQVFRVGQVQPETGQRVAGALGHDEPVAARNRINDRNHQPVVEHADTTVPALDRIPQ